jgi:hypothetical protein
MRVLEYKMDTPEKKDDYTQMVVADEHPSSKKLPHEFVANSTNLSTFRG